MRLRVATADIAAGQRNSPSRCPLARALSRRGWTYPHVYGFGAWDYDGVQIRPFLLGAPTKHYTLSKPAQRFLVAFDDGRPVRPGRFTVIEV